MSAYRLIPILQPPDQHAGCLNSEEHHVTFRLSTLDGFGQIIHNYVKDNPSLAPGWWMITRDGLNHRGRIFHVDDDRNVSFELGGSSSSTTNMTSWPPK